jgi:hypothetical protein
MNWTFHHPGSKSTQSFQYHSSNPSNLAVTLSIEQPKPSRHLSKATATRSKLSWPNVRTDQRRRRNISSNSTVTGQRVTNGMTPMTSVKYKISSTSSINGPRVIQKRFGDDHYASPSRPFDEQSLRRHNQQRNHNQLRSSVRSPARGPVKIRNKSQPQGPLSEKKQANRQEFKTQTIALNPHRLMTIAKPSNHKRT